MVSSLKVTQAVRYSSMTKQMMNNLFVLHQMQEIQSRQGAKKTENIREQEEVKKLRTLVYRYTTRYWYNSRESKMFIQKNVEIHLSCIFLV